MFKAQFKRQAQALERFNQCLRLLFKGISFSPRGLQAWTESSNFGRDKITDSCY